MAQTNLEELGTDAPSTLILYVLGKMDGGVLGETQFQAAMFRSMLILGMDPVRAGYRPHPRGPYSDLMADRRGDLIGIGCLEETGMGVRVSEEARGRASAIRIPGHVADPGIGHMVNYMCGLTSEETLLMMYCDDERRTGGRFIDGSSVRQEIYRNRVPTAIGLYRRGKVSLDRAAELAGVPPSRLQDELIASYGPVDEGEET